MKQWKKLGIGIVAVAISSALVTQSFCYAGEVTEKAEAPNYRQNVGEITWDCVYFGNYWQSAYKPIEEPDPQTYESEIMTDSDGTKYLLKTDGSCYKYEPIKWRVLSAKENDVFLIADKTLDLYWFNEDIGEEGDVKWQDSALRTWLNSDFYNMAFSDVEKEAIIPTEVVNENNPWSDISSGDTTLDYVYVPSLQELLNTDYGFSRDTADAVTRRAGSCTDYFNSGGITNYEWATENHYWTRSAGQAEGYPAYVGFFGTPEILTEQTVHAVYMSEVMGVRPVLHLDLSKTDVWEYAGRVTPYGEVPEAPLIKSAKSTKKKNATVTLKQYVDNADKYEVVYATNSSFKKSKKKTFVKKSITLKSLKSKKTYYVKVRACNETDDAMIYGQWSAVKKFKVK